MSSTAPYLICRGRATYDNNLIKRKNNQNISIAFQCVKQFHQHAIIRIVSNKNIQRLRTVVGRTKISSKRSGEVATLFPKNPNY